MNRTITLGAAGFLGVAGFWLFAAGAVAAEPVDYQGDVQPILVKHCVRCHGPDEQQSDLRVDTGKSLFEGGDSGAAIVAGKPAESLLLLAVRGQSDEISQMPPEEEDDRLSAQEIDILERWIAAGAAFPDKESPQQAAGKKSEHWSFQPIVAAQAPALKAGRPAHNAIDAFVLARLKKAGLAPSPPTDRATLIRRVSFDLTGLPPSPEEVQAFLADRQPAAYERLVDRLLASPMYGERWGRHWLDQARYADSDGYTNDVPRVMWRYRDWVIDAINRDLPFDQFTVEQFAGDLLPSPTPEQIIATGFHRCTQINHEGGSDAEQYRVEAVVDRVSTTGVVYLGLTLGCARCHSHKFDPISQSEFYQLYAFLNSQDEPTYTVTLDVPEAALLPAAQQKVNAASADLARHIEQSKAARQAWETALAQAGTPADLQAAAKTASKDRTKEQTALLENAYRKTDAELRRLAAALKKEQAELARLQAAATTTTYTMQERKKPRETFIHIRGDFLRPGKRVTPQTPSVFPKMQGAGETPNRLDLAHWLVAKENPLTARVTVNRTWQYFFGQGIVVTEGDFGTQGAPPSHPQLLDWLAAELVRQQWSMKQLHRLVVCSATYRQSSESRQDLIAIDPQNRLLARQTRLRVESETIRDAALAVAGLLSHKMHGPSVFPPQPATVMKMTRNPNRGWKVSPGEDRYRRGLYTYFWRNTPYAFLKLFNSPESNTTCTRRERSNTSLQALTLLNDEVFVEAAQGLAVRVLREAPEDDVLRIRYVFQVCFSREPLPAELAALKTLLAEELAAPAEKKPPRQFAAAAWLPEKIDARELLAWTTLARTLLNVDEFITRE